MTNTETLEKKFLNVELYADKEIRIQVGKDSSIANAKLLLYRRWQSNWQDKNRYKIPYLPTHTHHNCLCCCLRCSALDKEAETEINFNV